MISGWQNRVYLNSGRRMYGRLPVLGRARGYWEFQLVFKGGARPSGVAAGDFDPARARIYVSHPDSEHGWTDDPDGVSEVFVLHFVEVPDELAVSVGPERPLVVELDEAEADRIARRLAEVPRDSGGDSVLASLVVQGLLVELSVLAISGAGRESPLAVPPDRVARALHWMEENVSGGSATVKGAAQSVGVSVAHLRRLFAESGRASPRRELLGVRVAAAQRCLRAGWRQKQIATFLGFSEVGAFSRAFTDYVGVSPGRWARG
ncbi:MAG: AraC family transcriptional regulator [Verrucomicrobiota bacterium]